MENKNTNSTTNSTTHILTSSNGIVIVFGCCHPWISFCQALNISGCTLVKAAIDIGLKKFSETEIYCVMTSDAHNQI